MQEQFKCLGKYISHRNQLFTSELDLTFKHKEAFYYTTCLGVTGIDATSCPVCLLDDCKVFKQISSKYKKQFITPT